MTTRPPARARPNDAQQRLARLIDGYLITQLCYVAAELRLADALAGGPRTAGELADAVGADRRMLHRVLRGLAAEEVLDEQPDGRFALGRAGELLRDGVPGSMRGAALARGGLYYRATAGLLGAVRDGGTPFEVVHGATFFDHLDARPDESAAFQASMAGRSAREAAAVVAAYDFRAFASVVDVGGGPGLLLSAVLDAAPESTGMLFDRPEVVRGARLPAVGGDFFVEVPGGADAYLLSRVLHDWDDADAVAILRVCRSAMSDRATLVVVEAVLPERAADAPAAVRMDLHMLTLLGGRERTAVEYRDLFDAAGLRLVDVVHADSASGLHVLVARPQ